MFKLKNKNKYNTACPHRYAWHFGRGVTIVEALVAVAIFSTSILGMVSLVASGVSSTNNSKSRIIASYLSQEGVEYIKNMRDTYALYDPSGAQTGWNSFVAKVTGSSCTTANGCFFNADDLDYTDNSQPITDSNQFVLSACNSAPCPGGALLYNSSTGKYGTFGVSTPFNRRILITQVNANEIEITSTVSWTQNSGTYYATFSDNVFNWLE